MNIAILSGKGGTGKTTVSTNLSLALKTNYIDCDVEEPNGFLFLNPRIDSKENVSVKYPIIDKEKCINCGKCVDVCQFNALAKVGKKIIVFEKLCHDCGACKIVCESNALFYNPRNIGRIEKGSNNKFDCMRGILNISEPMAVPIIKKLLNSISIKENNLIDCPPGTSCNVVNVLNYSDVAILVTEPSAFGLHDLKMAVELVKLYNIPFYVIINKDDNKNNLIRNYCEDEVIMILGTIPYDQDIAKIYSRGELLYNNLIYKDIFDNISNKLKEVLSWN